MPSASAATMNRPIRKKSETAANSPKPKAAVTAKTSPVIKNPQPAPAKTKHQASASASKGKKSSPIAQAAARAREAELERLTQLDNAHADDPDAAFEAEQETQALSVSDIIMGTGKSSSVRTNAALPPQEFLTWAKSAVIEDPNPTLRLRITPEIAAAFLARTHINRKLWPGAAAWLTKQIKNGDWNDKNGDVIRFNTKGELIDGQHRLAAILASGKTIDSDVKFGVPDDAQATIDVGRKRSVSDQLHLMGERHSAALSATIRWLFTLALDDVSYRLNTQETVRFLERNPDVRKSVAYVHNSYQPRGTISTLLAAIHYIGAECLGKPDEANAFVEVFRSGQAAQGKHDAAHKLRERNLRFLTAKGATLTQRAHMESLIYAWNLFSQEKPAARWDVPEKPTIEGFEASMLSIDIGDPINVEEVLRKHRKAA